MKRWLVILLLSILSYTDASLSNNYQTYNTKQLDLKPIIEDLRATLNGSTYLYNTHKIETDNIPNGCPINLNKLKRISDLYGMRMHPLRKRKRMHHGIDFSAPRGTEVLSAGNGVVTRVAYSASYGRVIEINHGNNIKTIYAHLKNFKVKKGQVINEGEHIADLGNSGMSTGAHLHYEIRVNNKPVDPLLLIFKSANKKESDLISYYTNQIILSDEKQENNNTGGSREPV